MLNRRDYIEQEATRGVEQKGRVRRARIGMKEKGTSCKGQRGTFRLNLPKHDIFLIHELSEINNGLTFSINEIKAKL